MSVHCLLLVLLSILPPRICGQAVCSGGTVSPGSRLPKTVSKDPAVAAAVYALRAQATGRLEIFVVTQHRLVPATPETIEGDYDYRIAVQRLPWSKLQWDLTHALETCAIERVCDERPLNCTWAVIGYDMEGARVLTIYLGGWGEGLINGTPVLMGPEVEQILQRHCAPLWQ
jgi:hypothetical protein